MSGILEPAARGAEPASTARHLALLRSCRYLYVAESATLGLGVRTARPVTAGAVIVADEDGTLWERVVTLREALAQGWERGCHLFQVGPDRFLPPRGCVDDLFNHSCAPSGGWRLTERGARFVAIRDLKAGEEVTYDYSCHLLSADEEMACACGAPSCRRLVGPFWTLPPGLQARYRALDVVSPALAR